MLDYAKLFDEVYSRKRANNEEIRRYKRSALYYRGYDPSFHRYSVYNGENFVPMVKKSLRMGKRVCEDWASLLWSEKLDLSIANKEKAIPYLVDLGFWTIGAKAIELAFGLGISCVAVHADFDADESGEMKEGTGKIGLSYYDAKNLVPISWDGNEISEIALLSRNGGSRKMVAHLKGDDGNYRIAVVEETRDGGRKSSEIETGSPVPLFSCFWPNAVDNLSFNFHGYASILQNSIDALQAIDNAFDGMDNEITLGRKRVYVSAETTRIVVQKDEKGKVVEYRKTFDPNDAVFHVLPTTNGTINDKPFVYSPNDPLRVDQFVQAINTNLNLLSEQVGLGTDYYKFDGTSVATATQVISQNSDTYRNLVKHEQVLEPAIKRLYRAIAEAVRIFAIDSPLTDGDTVEVVFDDSIIEDKASEKEDDLKDLQNGIISKSEFRSKWRCETAEDAKSKIDGMVGDEDIVDRFSALSPAIASSLLTTKMAVHLIFRGKEGLLKEAGYSSIDDYIEDVESGKPSLSAEDIFGIGDRISDGEKEKTGIGEPPKSKEEGDEDE